MSYWSDVYAGEAAVIARAFTEGHRAEGPGVLAHAELSGVVPDETGEMPNSPNVLTEIASDGALTFSAGIAEHLAGDPDLAEATSGAYRMTAAWTALFAGLADDQVEPVAQRWASACDPGDDAARLGPLVSSLRHVCRVATDRDVPVVYTWMM